MLPMGMANTQRRLQLVGTRAGSRLHSRTQAWLGKGLRSPGSNGRAVPRAISRRQRSTACLSRALPSMRPRARLPRGPSSRAARMHGLRSRGGCHRRLTKVQHCRPLGMHDILGVYRHLRPSASEQGSGSSLIHSAADALPGDITSLMPSIAARLKRVWSTPGSWAICTELRDTSAGLVPGSAAEALRVTHGRPPCALISFGIGGRAAILKPTLARGAHDLRLLRWSMLPKLSTFMRA